MNLPSHFGQISKIVQEYQFCWYDKLGAKFLCTQVHYDISKKLVPCINVVRRFVAFPAKKK